MIYIVGSGVYIPSVDAKDLYIANHMSDEKSKALGFLINVPKVNLRRYINTLDYSLDLIRLRDVYKKVYRNNKFSFVKDGKEYTSEVINVTFKYSNKEFNMIGNNIYVRFGYRIASSSIKNGAYIEKDCNGNDYLIAIQTGREFDKRYRVPDEVLGEWFEYKNGRYSVKNNQTLNTRAELRGDLYKNGFICDGIHYVRFKRSAGSARVGKCLFIDEALYARMHKIDMMGIDVKEGDECDLASLECYTALTLSSIIDTVTIDPKNILLIDDYESVFGDDVVGTYINDGKLKTEPMHTEIRNSIWDGQSLIDISLMDNYQDKGMVLLRNNFFKSCCFNTNIQDFFKDNGITEISQLNGKTKAEKISDIKLITTPNSIKFLKFGTFDEWIDRIDNTFGVVKYEKKTHFFNGSMVQTHYQLINTLHLTKEEMKEFLSPTLNFLSMMRDDPSVLRWFIGYENEHEFTEFPISTKNDIVFNLMGINEKFTLTKIYKEFRQDLIQSIKSNMRLGHIWVYGNYSTLCGNPYEMLLQSIGKFDGTSILGTGNIHTKRFDYGKTLLGSRSPHVSMGDILLAHNIEQPLIDKYFNMTEEIVAVNSIGENLLFRLSGSDFDSDTVLLTDNTILIKAAQRHYQDFRVAVSMVDARKTKRTYCSEEQNDLDIKTSINKIGEIINLSQELNTYIWDSLNNGNTLEDIMPLYYKVCQLNVMSNIEIDKAKREFVIDNYQEMIDIKNECLMHDEKGRMILPYFFTFSHKLKGYYDGVKKNYKHHDTAMDYLEEVIDETRITGKRTKNIKFTDILSYPEYSFKKVQYKKLQEMIDIIKKTNSEIIKIVSNDNLDKNSKRYLYLRIIYDQILKMNEIKLNEDTLFWFLKNVENEDFSYVKVLLLIFLFNYADKSLYNLIKSSKTHLDRIESDKNGEIDILGKKYRKLS